MGLVTGRNVTAQLTGLVVKPEAALRQIDQDKAAARPLASGATGETQRHGTIAETPTAGGTGAVAPQPPPGQPHRFYATVKIDPRRLSTSAGTIAQEVVQHLAGLIMADVEVTLDIRAYIPGGAPDHIVRTVTENCHTLGFESYEFHDEEP